MWLKYHINLKQKLEKLEIMTSHKLKKPSYITKHLTRYKNKKNHEMHTIDPLYGCKGSTILLALLHVHDALCWK